ncbi:MAG TPA: hypothetical protein VN699_18755 [Pirellulales bacterium]|nr:hypothetical protein [Pirellulales bacterium]
MRTIWHSLLWREWHEHKWKLAALSAILLAVQAYLIFDSPGDAPPPIMFWYGCLIPGAFFVALGTATGERISRTLDLTRALPIKTWQAASVKLGMAAITCLSPLAISALAALIWRLIWQLTAGGDSWRFWNVETTPGPLLSCFVAAGLTISVLLWVTAAAIRQPNELRASAAGAAMLLGWIAVSIFSLVLIDWWRPHADLYESLVECLIAVGPGGFLLLLQAHGHPRLDLALQLSSLAAVSSWTLYRFGQFGAGENRSPRAAAAPQDAGRSALPQANWRPLTAIAWKQWRESVPLCLAGVALVAGIVVLRAAAVREGPLNESAAATFRVMMLWAGTVTAMIVAVGSFAGGLQPAVWAFWRSRPISPAAWFWTKYLSGAAAVLLFLDGPLLVGSCVWTGSPLRSLGADVLLDCSLAMHLLAYTAAVCMTCWVRQGVYAGILSVAALLAIVTAPINRPWLARFDLTQVLGAADFRGFAHGAWFSGVYLPFAAGMSALALAALTLAWVGVKREQGFADREGSVPFRPAKWRPFVKRKAT